MKLALLNVTGIGLALYALGLAVALPVALLALSAVLILEPEK